MTFSGFNSENIVQMVISLTKPNLNLPPIVEAIKEANRLRRTPAATNCITEWRKGNISNLKLITI